MGDEERRDEVGDSFIIEEVQLRVRYTWGRLLSSLVLSRGNGQSDLMILVSASAFDRVV